MAAPENKVLRFFYNKHAVQPVKQVEMIFVNRYLEDFLPGDFFAADLPREDFFAGDDLFRVDFFAADFLPADFVAVDLPPEDFFAADFFFGTLLPLFLASDKPIAIACLRLVTFFPLRPLFRLPSFFSFMARSTFLPAPAEYFAI